jgi:hypothetical protein
MQVTVEGHVQTQVGWCVQAQVGGCVQMQVGGRVQTQVGGCVQVANEGRGLFSTSLEGGQLSWGSLCVARLCRVNETVVVVGRCRKMWGATITRNSTS